MWVENLDKKEVLKSSEKLQIMEKNSLQDLKKITYRKKSPNTLYFQFDKFTQIFTTDDSSKVIEQVSLRIYNHPNEENI